MNYLGQKIRKTREENNLILKQVASYLKIDTALLSKAERGDRNFNRAQVITLAKFFNSSEEEYLSLWLCDKVIKAVNNDPLATQGIKKALTKIKK